MFVKREVGSPGRVAHVLFHSCPGCSADWDAVLARRGDAYAVAVDLPDHGAAPEATHDVPALERAADEVLASIGAPTLVLAGVSFGGWLAARLAERHPERVARIVAISGFARLPAEGTQMRRRLAHDLREGALSVSQLLDASLGMLVGSSADDAQRAAVRRSLEAITAAQWERHLLRAASLDQPELAVRNVVRPATVVHAQRDPAVPFASGEELARLASVPVTAVDADAHLLPVTHPELVASAVFAG